MPSHQLVYIVSGLLAGYHQDSYMAPKHVLAALMAVVTLVLNP